jgi:menaquinol-cytochrome c reductase iron-sulfur subunit
MSTGAEEPRGPLGEATDRRGFFARVGVILGALAAAVAAIPVAGYMLAPFFRSRPRRWRDVGAVEAFEMGKTVEVSFEDASSLPWSGVTAKTGAWLRRHGREEFIAYSLNCTHLGCPVRWVEKADLFMCPCHGGVYYDDGRVAAGPPPRPLSRYPVRIRNDRVEIETTPIPIT